MTGIVCSINAADCITKYDKDGCDEVVFDVGSEMKLQQYKVIYDKDQDGVVDSLDKCLGTPFNTKVDKDGCPIPVTPEEIVKEEIAEDEILAAVAENQLVTVMTLDIEFDVLKSDIKEMYEEEVEKFANYLLENPTYFVKIVGHTDSNDRYEVNKELSQSRADSVKNALVKLGVESNRLTAVGMGPNEPIASNATVEGRTKNRRIEVTITTKEGN